MNTTIENRLSFQLCSVPVPYDTTRTTDASSVLYKVFFQISTKESNAGGGSIDRSKVERIVLARRLKPIFLVLLWVFFGFFLWTFLCGPYLWSSGSCLICFIILLNKACMLSISSSSPTSRI